MFYTAVLLLFAVGARGAAVQPKSSCVDLDSVIENKLLSPIREKISSSSSEFVPIPNWGFNIFSWGIYGNGGVIGDAHSFHLAHQEGNRPSSEMCTGGNTQTLRIDLEFDELEAVYNKFAINIPYLFDIGETKTSIGLTDSRISAKFTITDAKNADNKCAVTLDDFTLSGNPHIGFDDGTVNMLIERIFNMVSPYFANIAMSSLNYFDISRKIAFHTAVPAITAQEKYICELIGNL